MNSKRNCLNSIQELRHIRQRLLHCTVVYLNNLRKDVKKPEDVVADEVVVAVVVLVLSSQEKRLAELPRVRVGNGDGTRHHEEHSA